MTIAATGTTTSADPTATPLGSGVGARLTASVCLSGPSHEVRELDGQAR